MFVLLVLYAVLLILAVYVGIHIARSFKPTHRRTQMAMSFVSGLMLGIAVFHLLPHAIYGADSISRITLDDHTHAKGVDFVVAWLMVGLIGMFLLQRLFHFHQHDFDEDYCSEHQHNHDFPSVSGGSAAGVFLGLTLHAMTDGVALAASIIAVYNTVPIHTFSLAGLGVFLAILLHKPLDAITIDVFMRKTSISSRLRWIVLLAFSMLCPVVAGLLLAGFSNNESTHPAYIVAALAFSSGIFLCIALSDLLPEIHFHTHDRLVMTLALLAGILFSLGIKYIEADSSHRLDFATNHQQLIRS